MVWVWGSQPSSLSSPRLLFPTSLVECLLLPGLHHVTRKCGSPPLPLLTERQYCQRGGRRWALLRRWLKITGIFKAAEESQGRQRLDSLPPGRSSRLPLSLFLADFSLSQLPLLRPFHSTQALQHDHDHHPIPQPHFPNPVEAHCKILWCAESSVLVGCFPAWPQLCPAIETWLGLSKQTAPPDFIHMHTSIQQNCQPARSVSIVALWKTNTELFCHKKMTRAHFWHCGDLCARLSLLVNVWTTETGVVNSVGKKNGVELNNSPGSFRCF